MDKKFLNHYGIEKHSRFTYYPNAIDGSIADMIKLCYEILDKTELNRFAIKISEHGTPELSFYEGMVGVRRLDDEEEKKPLIKRLFRRKDV